MLRLCNICICIRYNPICIYLEDAIYVFHLVLIVSFALVINLFILVSIEDINHTEIEIWYLCNLKISQIYNHKFYCDVLHIFLGFISSFIMMWLKISLQKKRKLVRYKVVYIFIWNIGSFSDIDSLFLKKMNYIIDNSSQIAKHDVSIYKYNKFFVNGWYHKS